jgi:hypothetical protein
MIFHDLFPNTMIEIDLFPKTMIEIDLFPNTMIDFFRLALTIDMPGTRTKRST